MVDMEVAVTKALEQSIYCCMLEMSWQQAMAVERQAAGTCCARVSGIMGFAYM